MVAERLLLPPPRVGRGAEPLVIIRLVLIAASASDGCVAVTAIAIAIATAQDESSAPRPIVGPLRVKCVASVAVAIVVGARVGAYGLLCSAGCYGGEAIRRR